MSSITQFLMERSSEPRLEAPAPPRDVVDLALQCAARAPDHALLRPWRYLVIEGQALAALGDLFAQSCGADASEKTRENARNAPLRAPMVIVGIASPKPHKKVPDVEQVMSAASGMSFLSLALSDAGYGIMWRSGAFAYDAAVRKGLGLSEDEIITGFLYTGTVSSRKPPVPRPSSGEFVEEWLGPEQLRPWSV
ncbi:MAG: nitroreductase [Gammaproteobacteria bacterium]|uniref:Putative NAD(P)H nitroreductase n=1 Tax=Marinobacter litoralis TaxID=187981 RepID=A0A3M2R9Q4_9GAMM|nr:nitroreductase [Marinobacter litoralis]MBR9869617.1 nitroreductase [Gammaproteobacteria bacterium]RMJ02023.1 putative NAD(P)H nitroreductase YdjA [Marinobacter litoralis]